MSKYQNVYTNQNMEMNPYDNYSNQDIQPYMRGTVTDMPAPMPGDMTETSLYPFETPSVQSYAKGGMVKKGKKKKDTTNIYPSIAEMIRQQGKGEDSILAHINPLEAMMLQQMGGSGTINPTTGLPQFGFLRGLRRFISPITNMRAYTKPVTRTVSPNKRRAPAPIVAPPVAEQQMVPYTADSTMSNAIVPAVKSTNEELAERLRNQISMDQSRLAGINYVPYGGETVAPISPATIRAQNLKNQWANRPAPYANKISSVLRRDIQGFSHEQQQGLLDMLRRGEISENMASERMTKQFGNNYGYEQDRNARLREKIGKDTNKNMLTSRAGIRNLSDELAAVEGTRRRDIVNALHTAGRATEGRRNALTNQLEEFGNLERNYRNLKNQANRDAFNEELNAPQRRISIANQALQGVNAEEMDPSRAGVNNAQLQRIMNFYNAPHINYPGQRVAPIEAETQQGYNLTYNMNPKYRDRFYDERKGLERGILSGPNLASQTYGKIPENLEPLMGNLDNLTKQELKQQTREISGRHRRMGTYGSGVHKAETEKASRNVLRRIYGEREKALMGVARNQSELANATGRNALDRYAQLAALGAKEFTDILGTHKNLVNSGNRQWANKQELENARLQSWYDQLNSELPMANNQLGNQGTRKYIMPV